jgi:hypothetical protein
MPEHVHIVIERFSFDVEKVVIQLKGRSTDQLLIDGLHPFQSEWDRLSPAPKCWAQGEWKVFIDDPDVIPIAIKYVEENPGKEVRPRQKWDFVTPYRGVI